MEHFRKRKESKNSQKSECAKKKKSKGQAYLDVGILQINTFSVKSSVFKATKSHRGILKCGGQKQQNMSKYVTWEDQTRAKKWQFSNIYRGFLCFGISGKN